LRVVARRLREEEQHDFRERQDPVEVDAVQDVVPLAPRPHEPRRASRRRCLERPASLIPISGASSWVERAPATISFSTRRTWTTSSDGSLDLPPARTNGAV
jgi:hypothetical protein